MGNKLSINRVKRQSSTSLRGLYNEYTRDETNAKKYDDGHRNIDINNTKNNVLLFDATDGHIEKYRHKIINEVNAKRKNRADLFTLDDAPEEKKTFEEKAKWLKRSNLNKTQKLRANAVDVITNVVQLGDTALSDLDDEQQELAYKAAFQVMQSHPEEYGEPLVASIHKDETSMHLQVMTSAIDRENLTCRAKKMFGNKSAMSKFQTRFVDEVNNQLDKDGYDFNLERGLKRIDNPEYKNFKDELTAAGYEVNRYNDNALLDLYKQKKDLQKQLADATVTQRDITRDMFDTVQGVKQTGFVYNRAVNNDKDKDAAASPLDCLTYTGTAKKDSNAYKKHKAEAVQDVKEFNEEENQPNSVQRVGLWMQRKMDEYRKKTIDRYKGIKSAIGRAYFDTVVTFRPEYAEDAEKAHTTSNIINNELAGKSEPGSFLRKASVKFMQHGGAYNSVMERKYLKLRGKQDDATEEYERKRKEESKQQQQQRTNFGPEV